jgi:hypothetical protein
MSLRNTYQRIEQVEGVELIEKYEIIVYSMDSGISLKPKALLRSEGSSPFFGTSFFPSRLLFSIKYWIT